jgi:hypothetical protein
MKEYRVNARLDERSFKSLAKIAKYLNCGISQAIRSALMRVDAEFFNSGPVLRSHAATNIEKKKVRK